MKDYEKNFEKQRDKMDEVLTNTYDLGQINALNTLINAVDNGTWIQISYKNVVKLRDQLLEKINS